MAIYFYKEFGELGYLATYSPNGFILDDVFYKTSEHYYQSKKFNDKNISDKIINANTPKEASYIGRDRSNKPIKLWRLVKCDVMFEAVIYKFLANLELRNKLLNTGNEEIIEETTKESFWGCGILKNGYNNYGKILSLVREKLKEDNMSYFTREGFEKLQYEYATMDLKYDEITRAMGKSDEMDSDLRENPEFMDLRVKAMYSIPNMKRELAQQIANAIVIEDTQEYKNWDSESVIRKCKVSLSIDDEEETYTILGYNEGNLRENILSCEAPLVLALLGHKIGETITFNGMDVTINNVVKIEEKEKKLCKTIKNEKNN